MFTFTLHGQEFKPRRIFCIGRNYVDHVKELENDAPAEPVVFMKPATSCFQNGSLPVEVNGETVHYECELVVVIGKNGTPVSETDAIDYIAGIGVGLDLTLREVQKRLRSKGLPWEISKSFDRSAVITGIHGFTPAQESLDSLTFSCHINGECRQEGNTAKMIYSIPKQILEISKYWKLMAGDIIYTGTPSGVGALKVGDTLEVMNHRGEKFTYSAH